MRTGSSLGGQIGSWVESRGSIIRSGRKGWSVPTVLNARNDLRGLRDPSDRRDRNGLGATKSFSTIKQDTSGGAESLSAPLFYSDEARQGLIQLGASG